MPSLAKDTSPQVCEGCGQEYVPKWRIQRFCRLACSNRHKERRHPPDGEERWRSDGYRLVYINGKPLQLHRLVYEESRGVTLNHWNHVSFLDGNLANVRPENLYLRGFGQEEYVRMYGVLPPRGARYCRHCRQIPLNGICQHRSGGTNPAN